MFLLQGDILVAGHKKGLKVDDGAVDVGVVEGVTAKEAVRIGEDVVQLDHEVVLIRHPGELRNGLADSILRICDAQVGSGQEAQGDWPRVNTGFE